MIDEMRGLRLTNEKLVLALGRMERFEEELIELKSENSKLHAMIMHQQNFLEGIDARERQRNAVVLGLPEDADDVGANDQDKLKAVLDAIECSTSITDVNCKRLGQANSNKKRPLLITFSSKVSRDEVLQKAKHLKSQHSETLKKVFIKKDVHPMWRKEYERLRKVVREEKARSENAGAEILYDSRRRVVTRDGLVIDRFQPGFRSTTSTIPDT